MLILYLKNVSQGSNYDWINSVQVYLNAKGFFLFVCFSFLIPVCDK